MKLKEAKVITITSVKGGVGKTTTTLNLAGIYSNKKIKTLIIDLDLYAGGIDLLLGLEPKRDLFSMIDDLNNNKFDNIETYLCNYNEYIDVLTAPRDPRDASKINSKYLGLILMKLKMKYDVILVDTNHFLNDLNLVMLDLSDEILYIVDNDLLGCKNMRTMVAIYNDTEKENYKVILNNSFNLQKSFFTLIDLKNMMNTNIDYIIPSTFNIKNIERYYLDNKIPTLEKKFKSKEGYKILEKICNNVYGQELQENPKKNKRHKK